MTAAPKARVAVVTSHPIQYHAPWFRGLSAVFDLHVFYAHRPGPEEQGRAGYGVAFEWDIDLLSGYSHSFLRNASSRPNVFEFRGCDSPDVGHELVAGKYDAVIVTGWYLKSYWQAILAARRSGLPVLVRGDSQLGTARPLAVRVAKELGYRWVMQNFDAFLVVGTHNRDYMLHYGAPVARCFSVPHFVDNAWFEAQSTVARASRQERRTMIGVSSDERVVLFVGRLIDIKRPLDIVRALAVLRARDPRVRGMFVGAGPLEQAVRAEAGRLGVPVQIAGFVNQSDMPAAYTTADCLVLASESETWGLVVNEAMACGLPVAVSDGVGCAPDMVREGQTGSVFARANVHACADAIERALSRADAPDLQQYLDAVLARHSAEAAVQGTLSAVRAVMTLDHGGS